MVSLNDVKMTILPSGFVGIGTTTPDSKLAVNGTVHAREVKIDLNVPAPDYVFEEKYKIMPLAEVNSYIAVHKHLPEIPSAADMEKNGVTLGEMNMKLLKKVEELTLYLIEKDQQLKAQEKINKQTEVRMQALEKRLNTRQKNN
jgi:hypothetical protein